MMHFFAGAEHDRDATLRGASPRTLISHETVLHLMTRNTIANPSHITIPHDARVSGKTQAESAVWLGLD
jgi:hypothetical protein